MKCPNVECNWRLQECANFCPGCGAKVPIPGFSPRLGRSVSVFMAGDLLDWFDTIPQREKSETICTILRERIKRA